MDMRNLLPLPCPAGSAGRTLVGMHILVSGASGLIGTALTQRLRRAHHTVVALVRRQPGTGEIRWDPAAGTIPGDALDGVDAIVNLAGAGINDHRWTEEYK